MRELVVLGCCWFAAAATWAQVDVSFTVDTGTDLHPISPFIYGVNTQDYAAAPARRLGGNRLTGYNWENNASHAGADWYHSNDNYLPWVMGVDPAHYEDPGIVLTTFHDASLANGAYSLITLQMAGYAARDKHGTVQVGETAPSPRWVAVVNQAPAPPSFPPDTTDGVLYIDGLLRLLLNTYGPAAGPTGIRGYALDNEPALWYYTHPRLFAHPVGVAELLAKSIDLSRTVKELDPTAEIFGPCLYGFSAYLNLQNAPDWGNYSGTYDRFVEAYLDLMRAASTTAGVRLLDVLDVHWYPEPDGVYEGDTTRAVAETRMQVTRSLWDSTYVEPSWIGQWFSPVAIVPYLQWAIDTYYPHTKLAITEYDYGAADHISGGLAQVDALGIFGRQGVYFGSKWGAVSDFIDAAYRLYRDCDGSGTAFGDLGVAAATSDTERSAIYAAVSGPETLHLILINRNYDDTIAGHFQIAGPREYSHGESWSFARTSTQIHPGAAIQVGAGNQFDFTLPPLTAHHLLLHRAASAVSANLAPSIPADIAVQPNPTRGRILLSYPPGVAPAGRAALYDVTGQRISEETDLQGMDPPVLECPGLAPGAYFLRIRTGGRVITRKILWSGE
jgi:hypothetical protein